MHVYKYKHFTPDTHKTEYQEVNVNMNINISGTHRPDCTLRLLLFRSETQLHFTNNPTVSEKFWSRSVALKKTRLWL